MRSYFISFAIGLVTGCGNSSANTSLANDSSGSASPTVQNYYRCNLDALDRKNDPSATGVVMVPETVGVTEYLGLRPAAFDLSRNGEGFVYFIHSRGDFFALLQISLKNKVIAQNRAPIALSDFNKVIAVYADTDNDGQDDTALQCSTKGPVSVISGS